MSKTIVITENGNREFAHDVSSRIQEKIQAALYDEMEKIEPETDTYINGKLTIWCEIKIHHEPYKDEK